MIILHSHSSVPRCPTFNTYLSWQANTTAPKYSIYSKPPPLSSVQAQHLNSPTFNTISISTSHQKIGNTHPNKILSYTEPLSSTEHGYSNIWYLFYLDIRYSIGQHLWHWHLNSQATRCIDTLFMINNTWSVHPTCVDLVSIGKYSVHQHPNTERGSHPTLYMDISHTVPFVAQLFTNWTHHQCSNVLLD